MHVRDEELLHIVAWHAVPPTRAAALWSSSSRFVPRRVTGVSPDAMAFPGDTELASGASNVKAREMVPILQAALTTLARTDPYPVAARARTLEAEIQSVEDVDVDPVLQDGHDEIVPKLTPAIDTKS